MQRLVVCSGEGFRPLVECLGTLAAASLAVLALPPPPGASVQHGQEGCSWQGAGHEKWVQEPCGE